MDLNEQQKEYLKTLLEFEMTEGFHSETAKIIIEQIISKLKKYEPHQ